MASCAADCESLNTGNDILILNEIRHALELLIEKNQVTTIDLRSIPMAPGEEARIEEILGKGEISIKLDALGPSEIVETSIAGVWLVTHRNMEEEVLGKFIEITKVPSLLATQEEDLSESLDRLIYQLSDQTEQLN